MKKKILYQMMLIFLIMIIGIFSCIPFTYATSITSLSCSSSSVKVGENFTVTLNLPADAYGVDFKIKVIYSDNTESQEKTIAYVPGMSGFDNKSATFSAKVVGNARVIASSINVSSKGGDPLETKGSTELVINIADNTPEPPPTPPTPTNPTNPTTPTTNTTTPNTNTTTPNEPTFTDVNQTVYTTDKVNLRKSYSTSSAKITTVDKGTKLTRTGVGSNNWSRINYNGQTVYISSQYLTTDVPDSEKEPTDVTFKDVNETMYAAKNCNIRKSWSTDSEKAGYLKKGDEVTRTGVGSNNWSRIKYNGQDLYVSTALLSKQKPEEDTKNEITNENVVSNETTVANEVTEGNKTELQNLQETIGVLPEVGNNIATRIYFVITIIACAICLIGIYYIKKDVK